MSGYIGTKSVLLSTTAATVTGNATIGGNLTVGSGIDVTGNVAADGLTVDGNVEISSASVLFDLMQTDTTDWNTRFQNNGSALDIRTLADNKASATTRMRINHNGGDIGFYNADGSAQKFLWDASEETLLIGKTVRDSTTAGAYLNETFGGVIVRDGGNPLLLNRLTSDGDIAVFRKDGTTVGVIGTYASDLTIGDNDVGIRFDTGSGLIPWNMTTQASTNGAIDLGGPSARFRNLYLSGGAYLGGTGASNLLDDYEEGTWTPSFEFDIGGSGITYGNRIGYYTKIGQLVVIQFTIEVTGGVGFSDYFLRLQVPFACTNVGNAFARVKVTNTFRENFNIATQAGTSSMLCYATSGATDYARGDDVPANTYVSGVISYRSTA